MLFSNIFLDRLESDNVLFPCTPESLHTVGACNVSRQVDINGVDSCSRGRDTPGCVTTYHRRVILGHLMIQPDVAAEDGAGRDEANRVRTRV